MARPSNTVVMIGRNTKDIIVNYYGEGDNSTAVARFSLAVDRGKKNADGQYETDFINCVAFGKTAEFIEKYFPKGAKMAVVGEIRTGSYTNKDGQKVYTTDVNVDKVDFVEPRKSDDTHQNANNGGQRSQGNNYTSNRAEPRRNDSDAFEKQSRRNDMGDGFLSIPDGVDDAGLPWN